MKETCNVRAHPIHGHVYFDKDRRAIVNSVTKEVVIELDFEQVGALLSWDGTFEESKTVITLFFERCIYFYIFNSEGLIKNYHIEFRKNEIMSAEIVPGTQIYAVKKEDGEELNYNFNRDYVVIESGLLVNTKIEPTVADQDFYFTDTNFKRVTAPNQACYALDNRTGTCFPVNEMKNLAQVIDINGNVIEFYRRRNRYRIFINRDEDHRRFNAYDACILFDGKSVCFHNHDNGNVIDIIDVKDFNFRF